MLDTYWSDHCRHTTFHTILDSVTFEDETLQAAWERYMETRRALGRTKPVCLMDLGTIAAKALRAYLTEAGLTNERQTGGTARYFESGDLRHFEAFAEPYLEHGPVHAERAPLMEL